MSYFLYTNRWRALKKDIDKMKLSDSEILALLQKFYPFLSRDEAEILFSISEYSKFKSKEIILKRGRNDKKVFIILKGSARAYEIIDGEELNTHLRSEGYLFGDPRAFDDKPLILLDIEAINDIDVLIFDLSELEALGYKNPKMMNFYLYLMKEVIHVFGHRIHTFVAMDSTKRYLDLLKWNPIYLKSAYDKHLASFLGVSPLTFLRIKKRTIK